MALFEVFSHSDRFHYRAKLCSLATCFLVLCTILTFLPPFLFTYYAEGFWIKEASYSEKPRVSYTNFVLNLGQVAATNPYFASSYASLNTIFQSISIPGTTAIATENDNRFSLSLELPFQNSNIQIRYINLLLILQYELRGRQLIQMETLGLINLYSPGTINNARVTAVGELTLDQRVPFQSSGVDAQYNDSVIDLDNILATSSMDVNSITDNYFTRNYYTTFQPYLTNWEDRTSSGTGRITIDVTVNIRTQSIRFIPGFWQEFKWGWIQYLSFLLPFIYIFHRVKRFVFQNQLVRTLVEVPSHRCKT
ncbi:unnamed protein product [Adineta ricciae]|uniref:Transmembrane protein 231 n=1 Tax=Adineta ricciae TaxID=249248 RepID=A0A813QKW1_ADIRI|nr:unnamed protein product [Adineta ricciae]CAF1065946.1 unnamed protein product [Adineta ricciae]